ncbi:Alpha/Beta hydrolase protein [Xylariaceae sp. FL0804]|nr:Alpha/Beta hydrolase protein [Xylariaceae sp. FL0804]
MLCKTELDYVDVAPGSAPLPRYGHLSRKTPAYAAAEPVVRAVYQQFHALPSLAAFRDAAGDPDAALPPGGPDRHRDVATRTLTFPARDGAPLELKVYCRPSSGPGSGSGEQPDVAAAAAAAPLVYRMHGGGWSLGSHEVDGAENVYAAARANVVVVSVKYRLAPEHPFPVPFNDCYDGLLWCRENAYALGINPEKIILAGSSAGGNLAAALALAARDGGIPGIVAQVAHFPATCHPKFFPRRDDDDDDDDGRRHEFKFEFGSYAQERRNAVLPAGVMETFWDAYAPAARPDPRHSPLLAASLAGLPPTLIQVAGADVLRDEGLAYAEALRAAGVEVETHVYPGVPHCFPTLLTKQRCTAEFYERFTGFLQRHGDLKT